LRVKPGKDGEEDGENMRTQTNIPLSDSQKACINDLADGQLRGDAFADAMALLETNSSARAAWHSLHITGDVLRGETTAHVTTTTKDMAFLDTFRTNLAKEPLLTPIPMSVPSVAASTVSGANDSFFNWKWVGGLSAAAAVVAFSWNLVSTTAPAPNGAGAQLAQSAVQAAPVATQTSAGVMLRNPQLDALIAAHNQVGGSSALQMPSGFLRSATFNPAVSNTVLSDK
jgi:sigma-E factor negative regulatory protein RseA